MSSAEQATAERPRLGLLLFVAGLAAAAGVDTLAKLLGARPVGELLAWRGFGAMPVLLLLAARRGGLRALRPRSAPVVLARGAVNAAATLLFFWSLRGLSLAAAYVIGFTAPLMLIAMAVCVGEKVSARSWAAVGVGFAGVLLAAAPGPADLAAGLPAAAALAATALYALGLLLVRHGPGGRETPDALVLGNLVMTGLLGAALLVSGEGAGAPTHANLPFLAMMAVLAAGSQILVTQAFALAPVSRLASGEYVTVPLGVLLGWQVWGEAPSSRVVGGALATVLGVALAARNRSPD